MPTKSPPPSPETTPGRRATQAELFQKFSHLDRHRAAVVLATRVLRILGPAEPETAEIAMEIAGTATRMRSAPNGALGGLETSLNADLPGAPRL